MPTDTSRDSTGNYVTIPHGVVDDIDAGYVGGVNLLSDQYQMIHSLITGLSGIPVPEGEETPANLFEVLEQLRTYIDKELFEFELPEEWQTIFESVVIDPLTTITEEERVTVPPFESTAEWPTEDVPKPQELKPIPDVDLSYTDPVLPDEVDPDLVWAENPYISPYWDIIFSKVYDVLENGATGLDEEAEQAIYDRAIARQQEAHADAYQQAIDAASTDGFDFAGGAQAAILLETASRLAQEETNLNNDIIVKQADLAYQAQMFFTDKAVALEQMLRQFHNDQMNRALSAKQAIAQFVLQKWSEKMKGYAIQWDGIKTMLMAKVEELNVIARQNEVIAKRFEIELAGHTAEVDLTAKKISAEVEAYKGTMMGIQAQVDEKKAWWSALTDEQKNQVERSALLLQEALGKIKSLLDGNMSLLSFREKILETMAQIMAQVLASALQSINTSITHGTSKSEGRTESYGHSDGLDESHTYTTSA